MKKNSYIVKTSLNNRLKVNIVVETVEQKNKLND